MLQFMVYFDDLEVPPWLFGNLSPLSSWRSMRQVYWTRGSPLVKPEEILDLGWLKIALPAIHIGHPHSWVPNIWICVLVNIYLSIYLSIYIYIPSYIMISGEVFDMYFQEDEMPPKWDKTWGTPRCSREAHRGCANAWGPGFLETQFTAGTETQV